MRPYGSKGDLSAASLPSLYMLSLHSIAKSLIERGGVWYGKIRTFLTDNMCMDLYLILPEYGEDGKFILALHLCRPHLFLPLLRLGHRRTELHHLLQICIDQKLNPHRDLILKLPRTFDSQEFSSRTYIQHLNLCLNLAAFLIEAGWYESCETLLRACLKVVQGQGHKLVSDGGLVLELEALEPECEVMLLQCLSSYSKFEEAFSLYELMVEKYNLVSKKEDTNEGGIRSPKRAKKLPTISASVLPLVYSKLSNFCFHMSRYQNSLVWSLRALQLLNNTSLPPKVVIDVLRQASQSCVVRRQFDNAELLIKQAVQMAKEVYGKKHPKYADCLTDYGFYLINVDNIRKSLSVYQEAFHVRKATFGNGCNLKVAFAFEDLAYATYVKEYNSGDFKKAKSLAKKSLKILNMILPENHLLTASSKRVLALILEEMAIDIPNPGRKQEMLGESEELHLSALKLALDHFGQDNVQTAKHYGNLGRLYQSMEQFEKAEEMHHKAIKIKKNLLGESDYEVALSIGHLASLYNYDMKKFKDAECLYLQSIEIGRNLFGEAYSGLEYDYRGLYRVYEMTCQPDKLHEYAHKLSHWKLLREEIETNNEDGPRICVQSTSKCSLNDVIIEVMRSNSN